MNSYHYIVAAQARGKYLTLYKGTDAAEAMAAWSKGISDSLGYIFLEALEAA